MGEGALRSAHAPTHSARRVRYRRAAAVVIMGMSLKNNENMCSIPPVPSIETFERYRNNSLVPSRRVRQRFFGLPVVLRCVKRCRWVCLAPTRDRI